MGTSRKHATISSVEWGTQIPLVGSRQQKDFPGGYQVEVYCVANGSKNRKYGGLLAHNDWILHCADYPTTAAARKDCIARMKAHQLAANCIPIVQARKRAA